VFYDLGSSDSKSAKDISVSRTTKERAMTKELKSDSSQL